MSAIMANGLVSVAPIRPGMTLTPNQASLLAAGENTVRLARYVKAVFALVLGAPALGGCWYSDEPLIVSATSVNPIEAGDYQLHSGDADDPQSVTLISIPGGGYIYSAGGEVLALMIRKIQADWYAMQFTGEGRHSLLAIGHVVSFQEDTNGSKINKKRVDYYDPPCDEALGALEGVTTDGDDCKFSNLEGLVAAGRLLATRLERGEHIERTMWSELEEELAAGE